MKEKDRVKASNTKYHEIEWNVSHEDILALLEGHALQSTLLSHGDKVRVSLRWDEDDEGIKKVWNEHLKLLEAQNPIETEVEDGRKE